MHAGISKRVAHRPNGKVEAQRGIRGGIVPVPFTRCLLHGSHNRYCRGLAATNRPRYTVFPSLMPPTALKGMMDTCWGLKTSVHSFANFHGVENMKFLSI